MKIDDIKKGKEYGLEQRHGDPRRVEALGIVTVEEQVWDNNFEKYKPRNVRMVEVKFLDPTPDSRAFKKGAKTKVAAKAVLAPWSELGPNIRKRVAEAEARDKLNADLDKRVKALLGRNYDGYVSVNIANRPSLDVRDKSLLKLLDLAEAGTRMKK